MSADSTQQDFTARTGWDEATTRTGSAGHRHRTPSPMALATRSASAAGRLPVGSTERAQALLAHFSTYLPAVGRTTCSVHR